MHRNTLVVIIVLALFALLIATVNITKKPESTPTSVSTLPSPTPTPLSASTCGISFSYPDYLTKVDIETGGATLVNTKKEGEAIVIICQEEIPRVPLTEDKIETLQIGSTSAQLYHDASTKDGTPIDKLIFTHPNLKNTDVYVAGYGEAYNELLRTIRIN